MPTFPSTAYVRLTSSRPEASGAVTVREQRAHRRSVRQIAADANDGEVAAGQTIVVVVRLHVEQADVVLARFSRQASAAEDRNRFAVRADADAPAEEQVDFTGIADGEEAGVLEKEGALLGKEQIEAIEVHLLVVDLDLREVRVDGGIEHEARRQAVFQIVLPRNPRPERPLVAPPDVALE